MDLEDFLEPEIAIVAAVTATVFSPRARNLLRRGAVYGLAGALIAGDAVTSFARNIGHSFQQATTSGAQAPEQPAPDQAKAEGEDASS
jgi:hypothetical protein